MRRMNNKNTAVLVLAVLVFLISILGPEQIARCKDRGMLDQIVVEEVDTSSRGYRYTLNSNERLYLLSECLKHQVLPESELSAMTRASVSGVDYESLIGSYSFVVNRQGPSQKEITEEQIYEVCNREMEVLKEQGVLPDSVKEVIPSAYSAVLYSAIDVLEPQNNMAVWKVSLSTSQQNADKRNRLIDAYIDAESGKIYELYVRTERVWAEMEPEEMIGKWSSYLGLTGREDYDPENPLLETTQDYRKYRFPGIEEGNTVVTIGFYEGINELFIKIT